MKRRLLCLLFSILSTLTANAEIPPHCASAAIRSVERPLSDGTTFTYRFSVSPGPLASEASPAVIFLPGGPGQTSMSMGLSYPDEFIVVRTDPRGAGCNAVPGLRDEDLTSERIAHDIVEIIRALQPRKYILHGTSYGSLVATMTAAFAREQNLPAPLAVVLEGTLGRAFKANEYLQGYLQQWQKWKPEVAPEVLRLLEQPIIFGIERKRWMAWLAAMMTYGKFSDGSSLLVNDLSLLKQNSDEKRREGVLKRVRKMSEPSTPDTTRLYRQIVCREFVSDIRDIKYDFDFVDGNLKGVEARWCGNLPMDRSFDSFEFQIQAPIYYFMGELDPATPEWQARYHFSKQLSLPRTIVSVKNAGHFALSGSLMSCSTQVWREIVRGDIAVALKSCPQTTVQIKK